MLQGVSCLLSMGMVVCLSTVYDSHSNLSQALELAMVYPQQQNETAASLRTGDFW